jgi:hypothetical protein
LFLILFFIAIVHAEEVTASETILSNESICNAFQSAQSSQSPATNKLESLSSSSDWDVAVRFDNAPRTSFYPFNSSPGVVGTSYYATLTASDSNFQYIPYCYSTCGWQSCSWAVIARQACDALSIPCESLDPAESGCICYGGMKNAARIGGWFVERERITDTQYRVKIRGQSSGLANPSGELWLNPSTGWKFTNVNSCFVQSDEYYGRSTYCELTNDTALRFQAAGDCGNGCACEDAGSIDIDITAEYNGVPTPTPTPTGTIFYIYADGVSLYHGFEGNSDLYRASTAAQEFYDNIVGKQGSVYSSYHWEGIGNPVDDATGSKNWNINEDANSMVNNADFAFHAGHGWNDGILFGTANPDYKLYRSDMQFGGNNGKAKWVALLSCNVLNQSTEPNWESVFNGLHILMSYDTEGVEAENQGLQFAQRLTGSDIYPETSIRKAWKLTLQNTIQNRSIKGAILYAKPSQDDYLPGFGNVKDPVKRGNGKYSFGYENFECIP